MVLSNRFSHPFDDSQPIRLTQKERITVTRRASQGLLWTLGAQATVALIATVLSGLLAGWYAAVSALVGAAAYFVPNLLFALRLLVGILGKKTPSPAMFFWGEAFKLIAALAILGLAAWLGQGWIIWPALLAGLFGVLKGYVLLLALRKLP